MPLFHPRVIEKKLRNAGDVLASHGTILSAWATNLRGGIFDREIQNDAEFIQRILIDVLGYVGSSAGAVWTLAKNQPVGVGNVDVALGSFSVDKEPAILALRVAAQISKKHFDGEQGFDQLLSTHYPLLRKLEAVGKRRLADIAGTENACATSDTYVLGEILTDAGSVHAYNPNEHYKVANTGTLGRFSFRWGARPMRYLKNDYTYPIVAKNDFQAKLGATYQRRAASPKLMIKGLTLLDAALDQDGSFVPGKSTLVICSDNAKKLKLLAGLINSKVASFYVKQKYASASYNGGVNFTPDMLNSIPVPDDVDEDAIIRNVETLIRAQEEISARRLLSITPSAPPAPLARFERSSIIGTICPALNSSRNSHVRDLTFPSGIKPNGAKSAKKTKPKLPSICAMPQLQKKLSTDCYWTPTDWIAPTGKRSTP